MTKAVIINTKNAYSMQEILTEFCKTYIITHTDDEEMRSDGRYLFNGVTLVKPRDEAWLVEFL